MPAITKYIPILENKLLIQPQAKVSAITLSPILPSINKLRKVYSNTYNNSQCRYKHKPVITNPSSYSGITSSSGIGHNTPVSLFGFLNILLQITLHLYYRIKPPS